MRVRLCGAGDLDALADLAAGFHASHRAIAPDDYRSEFDAANAAVAFGEVAASAEHLLAVADSGIGLAGYLWGQLLDRPETPFTAAGRFVFVHQLYVAPDCRRASVATTLIEEAVVFGQMHGASDLILDVVPANASAFETFVRRGFRTTGVVMRRPLINRAASRSVLTALPGWSDHISP